MVIKRNIRALVNPHGGDVTVRVRVSWAGLMADFYPGITVSERCWDRQRRKVSGCKDAARHNRAIAQCLSSLEDFFQRYEVMEGRIPTEAELEAEWERMTGTEEPSTGTLHDLIGTFLSGEGEERGWADNTRRKFITLRNHIDRFYPSLETEMVTEDTISSLASYMTRMGHRNSTVAKNVKFLRWVLAWAKRKGLYHGDAHTTYRPRMKGAAGPSEIVFLTREELARVEAYRGKRYLERIRDLFLFSCYSGLRFGDCQSVTPDMVRDDALHITTGKTSTPLVIQLNRRTREILERGIPRMTNQSANRHLHELLREAGVDSPVRRVWYVGGKRMEDTVPKYEAVTFHAARRTFVTQGLALGIPPEVLVKWTGHSGTSHLKPYLDVVEQLRRESMDLYDRL